MIDNPMIEHTDATPISLPVATIPPAAETRPPAPRGGQRRTELPIEDMTGDELKILKCLFSAKGDRVGKPIHVIHKDAFGSKGYKATGTSRVRNALRRLVRFGWLEKVDLNEAKREAKRAANAASGHQKRAYTEYRLTEKGRKRGVPPEWF